MVHPPELPLPRKRYRPFLKPYWKSRNLKELHAVNRQKRNTWICDGKPRSMQFASYRDHMRAKRELTNALKRTQRQYEQEEFICLKETAELNLGLFYRS